jgi:GH24 family phage-related lysozyme (muramidase)
MVCIAPDFLAATNTADSSKPAESTLLKGFNQAITMVTVCHTGGNQVGSCNGGVFTCGVDSHSSSRLSKGFNTKDLADAADQEAQKVINMICQRMSVSKAIMDDVEVFSVLVERFFA